MARLSQHLFALGRPNLERQLAHPTVRGIATGDLDQTRFRAWLVQDYLFLLDYVRLFALAAARAPDGDTLGRLVDLAHATFHEELSLHRAYAAEFGLAEVDLDRAEKSPVCAAYTDFLLRAGLEQLAGLPPALVITAEADVLRDEGEAYADKLREAGVPVIADRFQAIIHDFVMLNALADTNAARDAITLATDTLRTVLSNKT